MRLTILVISLLACRLFAFEWYHVKKLPAGSLPAVDGSLAEWNEAYYLDSLRYTDNCFINDDLVWTPSDFQMKVYAAHNGATIFFAIRVTSDDFYRPCHVPGSCDAVKVNPGGQARAFYLFPDRTCQMNPSCPFTLGSTLNAAAEFEGNGNLPTYELSMSLSILDPTDTGSFRLSVEADDEDSAAWGNSLWAGLGVSYPGSKTEYGDSHWDNPLLYALYTLDSATGPPITAGGADTTPPVVLDVSAAAVGATGASISVTTDEAALVTVICDGRSQSGSGYYSNQTVSISSLSPTTFYSYDVRVEDGYGNADTAGPYTFTTVDSLMPSTYDIWPVSGFTPIIDGTPDEWPAAFFLDSLHGDENVYARTGGLWQRNEIQYHVFAAHDGLYVYFAIKVVADNAPRAGRVPLSFDDLRLNPGGCASSLRIMSGDTIIRDPASPFDWRDSLSFIGRANPAGNGPFPTYECAMRKSIIDPFGMGRFQHSVGVGDEDTLNGLNACWTAAGAVYTGNKQDWSSNPWDNPLYYPTFLLQSAGPAAETKKDLKGEPFLRVHPNPFNPATGISCHLSPGRPGIMRIFDIRGKMVFERPIQGSGTVVWNAEKLGSGVYVLKVFSAGRTYSRKLVLQR